jgi:hypothetical protein
MVQMNVRRPVSDQMWGVSRQLKVRSPLRWTSNVAADLSYPLEKKRALFPEYVALADVMQDTGTARPIHLHQSTSLPANDAERVQSIMFPRTSDVDCGRVIEDGRDQGDTAAISGPSNRGGQANPAPSAQPFYSTALANPRHPTPAGDTPPRQFESARAEELYRRGLAHRTRDAIDEALLDSDAEEDRAPPAKRNKQKRKTGSQTVTDTISASDQALITKVDEMRKEAIDVANKKFDYEQKPNEAEAALREREVAAREKEVNMQEHLMRNKLKEEFLALCRKFPDDWDLAGRMTFGGKEAWAEVAEDMKAHAKLTLLED